MARRDFAYAVEPLRVDSMGESVQRTVPSSTALRDAPCHSAK